MKQIATVRMGQVAAKYGEQAPMASACCNACRTCVTTNLVAIVGTALAAAGALTRTVSGTDPGELVESHSH